MKTIKKIKSVTTASTLISVGAVSGVYAQSFEQEVNNEAPIVVTASRLPESDSFSRVDVITAPERVERQLFRLQDTLDYAPGVTSTSIAGQEGQTGSLIIRGLPTRYNQLLIDGVRVSDAGVSGGTTGNLLGNFSLTQNERIEVVNGAQGGVHGSSSVGGVVGVYSPFSTEPPRLSLSQEIGSFEYTRSEFSSNGEVEGLSYYLSLSNTYQEQDLPSSQAFQVTNQQASLGLQYELNENNTIRLTGRAGLSELESSFATYENSNELFSLQLLSKRSDFYESALVIGHYFEDYDAVDGVNGDFQSDFSKWSFTFDNSISLSENIDLKAGVDFSWNEYSSEIAFFGAPNSADWSTYGVYAGVEMEAGNFSLDAGVRTEFHSDYDVLPSAHAQLKYTHDYFTSFGKVSVGSRAPSLLETEAFPAGGQLANDDLEEEQVLSVELGVEAEPFSDHRIALTAYGHFLSDAITLGFSPDFSSQYSNADGVSEVFGLEFASQGVVFDTLKYQLSWDYALKNDVVQLARNTFAGDLYFDGERWLVGAGISHRTRASYGAASSLDSHVITRLYGEYALTDWCKVNARVENLFDEKYEVDPFAFDPTTFAPAQELGKGASLYAGLTLSW